MNPTFAITLAVFSICVLFGITGPHSATVEGRKTRAVGLQICPEEQTMEQCLAEAQEAAKSLNYCNKIEIDGRQLQHLSCGTVACQEPLIVGPENLEKPYPDCCARCIEKIE